MVKYWLVFDGVECDAYYSNLVICDTKEEAIDIFIKATNYVYSEEDEEIVPLEAIELKPYTINSLENKKKDTTEKTKIDEESGENDKSSDDKSSEEDSNNDSELNNSNNDSELDNSNNDSELDNSNEEEFEPDDVRSAVQIPDDKLIFVMFEIYCNLGSDMNGKYFVQVNGNEEQIEKFKKINKNGDVKFNEKKYTWSELNKLRKMKDLWKYDGSNDNVERLILKGKLTVPDKNKSLNTDELLKWWKKYLKSNKWPQWSNIVEEVIDLAK
ncbi:putative ORFan [Tupanvirus deep ocean]|uniref:ORFan n=2 Tax=Tupanvirus TaxID=2094720 RepID=A0AC62A9P3_9VIRU|nr:putative ORFan [Tupanvirus deep ocean]QKU34392.1 putative ORFan [Tupanvirus deep ocean]